MGVQEDIKTGDATDLKARYTNYKTANPTVRIRNAAADLGVSEAALVATGIGQTATRLDGDWGDIIRQFPKLGEILCITRGDHAVHEKVGKFANISIGPGHGLVVNHDIDLRLFLSHWHHCFAVSEETKQGARRSIQFFDIDGTAVHKVYMRDGSDAEAYDALVARFKSPDQSPDFSAIPHPPKKADRPDADIDREGLRAHWAALKDTHDFIDLLRDFEVGRQQAFRLVGEDMAYRIPMEAFETALTDAVAAKLPIMIFVGNRGCIQIHTDPIERVVRANGWLNILDPGFNLHLKDSEAVEAWVVHKPTRDGIVTSIELFDNQGREILYMFGERKPGVPELQGWRDLVAGLDRLDG